MEKGEEKKNDVAVAVAKPLNDDEIATAVMNCPLKHTCTLGSDGRTCKWNKFGTCMYPEERMVF